MTVAAGVSLGRLLLALDRTVAQLVTAPAGLDAVVSSAALLDVDDVRLGLGRAARGADVFLFVGVPDEELLTWLCGLDTREPVAVFCKSPSAQVVARAEVTRTAVVAVDPHARWERIYHLVMRVLEADPGGVAGESMRTGTTGDLFDLAAEVARRTRGLVSIEDERSHVLAYSRAGDEADELRRLSILGREGPPEMMAWLRDWGVMDVLRRSSEVVRVAEHTDLGVRARRAVAIRVSGSAVGEFVGVIWLQRGGVDFADDTDEVLTGAAAVAARVISRGRARGNDHAETVRRLLGARGDIVDAEYLGAQLGLATDASVAVVGLAATSGAPHSLGGAAELSAVTLHASAFSPLSVTATLGSRIYVVLPEVTAQATVTWARAVLGAAERQFGARLRAVVAGPDTGLGSVPRLRGQADRVLDAAEREGELIDDVATVEESQTGVLLGEIVAHLAANPELVDSRVVELVETDELTGSEFTLSLRTYLDHFGDVRAAAAALHVHPNTLRYRVRRLQALTGMDLDDPATRLVVALSLRAVRG